MSLPHSALEEQILVLNAQRGDDRAFELLVEKYDRVLGSFDPWSKEATPLSIALGVIYVISSVAFWTLLASFYSRFRPRTRAAEDSLRDVQLLQLASQLESLQKEVAALKNGRPSS